MFVTLCYKRLIDVKYASPHMVQPAGTGRAGCERKPPHESKTPARLTAGQGQKRYFPYSCKMRSSILRTTLQV